MQLFFSLAFADPPHRVEGCSPGSHRELLMALLVFFFGGGETVTSLWLEHNQPNKAQHSTLGTPIFAREYRRKQCTKALGVWSLLLCFIWVFFLDNMKLVNTQTRWCNMQQQEMEIISYCFLPLVHSPDSWRTFKSPSAESWVCFMRQYKGCSVWNLHTYLVFITL